MSVELDGLDARCPSAKRVQGLRCCVLVQTVFQRDTTHGFMMEWKKSTTGWVVGSVEYWVMRCIQRASREIAWSSCADTSIVCVAQPHLASCVRGMVDCQSRLRSLENLQMQLFISTVALLTIFTSRCAQRRQVPLRRALDTEVTPPYVCLWLPTISAAVQAFTRKAHLDIDVADTPHRCSFQRLPSDFRPDQR